MMLNRVSDKRSVVSGSAIADCPFSAAEDYALDFLQRAKFSTHLHRDNSETGRAHDEIRIFWERGSKLFPKFHGTVRFRIARNRTRVLIEGTYAPPFGFAGRVFDKIAGKLIARATLPALASRLAAHLSARHAAWLQRLASLKDGRRV